MTDVLALSLSEEQLLSYAASAEKASEHPLGEAIVREAQDRGYALCELESFHAMIGRGIEGVILGQKLLIGNLKLMVEHQIDVSSLQEKTDE